MKKFLSPLLFASLFLFGCSRQIVVSTVSDLNGLKIGCQAGTTGEDFLLNDLKGANTVPFRTGSEAALALKNKTVDVVMLDELPARQLAKENPDLKVIDLQLKFEEYAIAVKKGNSELLEKVNKTIDAIHKDGTYLAMIRKFMPLDGNVVIPKIEPADSNEVLKMGTNASFPPFEYTEGTKVVGFDASLGELIAKNNGKRLHIIDMSFGSLIEALQSGTIDFIAAGMTVTEERKKLVDFSEPYFSSKQVVIVRR
ncbi:MAG: transporter substrate-binding domain-containing protein [Treponema sp.]|nr:transporter substrate-binding domain-containing protein [Candidatus Treponema equifaecale]